VVAAGGRRPDFSREFYEFVSVMSESVLKIVSDPSRGDDLYDFSSTMMFPHRDRITMVGENIATAFEKYN
jgi:hypothetical protein